MSDVPPFAAHAPEPRAEACRPRPRPFHGISMRLRVFALLLLTPSPRSLTAPLVDSALTADNHPLEEQREDLLQILSRDLQVEPRGLDRIRQIFARSSVLGQGNPRLSEHVISRAECEEQRKVDPLYPADAICKAPNMVALYDPEHEDVADARVCIDQFEFPNVPCEYPIVHVQANEAAELCEAIGKRLCDAHEWEGACAGALHPPDTEYAWDYDRRTMRARHNATREVTWAYGSDRNLELCATASWKTPGCLGSGYAFCGSNTFPTASFPACVSSFGVYDLHGNVAEHMNLPLTPAELGSRGGHGATEMKGSWFVFGSIDAHPDDCRWRAPDWHASDVQSPRSHSNYHLGFRCCKDV
jgi:sulfatase modifying factor 1